MRAAPGSFCCRVFVLTFLAVTAVASARAQELPAYDRRLAGVELVPTRSPGVFDVRFRLEVALFERPEADLDLSSVVVLREAGPGGRVIREIPFALTVPVQRLGDCAAGGCEGVCGTARTPHGTVEMECRRDPVFVGNCSCQLVCPGWCEGCAIDGDLVIEVVPMDGALPELFVDDDIVVASPPSPPAVNRRIEGLELVPSAEPGRYEVRYELAVELYERPETDLDVSSVVVLYAGDEDGEVIGEFPWQVSIPAQSITPCDIAQPDCAGECGTGTAPHGTVELRCRPSAVFAGQCACTLVCPGSCEDCAIDGPIVARVFPAPNAVPESYAADDVAHAAPPSPAPRTNRAIQIQSATPSGAIPGGHDVLAVAWIQLLHSNPSPLDLSTRVLFQDEDQNTLHSVDIQVEMIGPIAGDCQAIGCPVNCAAALIDGVITPTICAEFPGSPFGCGCTVRVPVSYFGGRYEGTVIVKVEPLAGSLAETHLADDRAFRVLPEEGPAAPVPLVDRRLDEVVRTPTPGGSVLEPHATLLLRFNGIEGESESREIDASTEVLVFDREGRELGRTRIDAYLDPSSSPCEEDGCGASCGSATIAGERFEGTCEPDPIFDLCGCRFRMAARIELDVPIDEPVFVELRPAPGSIGEVETRGDQAQCAGGSGCEVDHESSSVLFGGVLHRPVGDARLRRSHDSLVVATFGDEPEGGVLIEPRGPIAEARFEIDVPGAADGEASSAGSYLEYVLQPTPVGEGAGAGRGEPLVRVYPAPGEDFHVVELACPEQRAGGHSGGVNVLMGDGSVIFLGDPIGSVTLVGYDGSWPSVLAFRRERAHTVEVLWDEPTTFFIDDEEIEGVGLRLECEVEVPPVEPIIDLHRIVVRNLPGFRILEETLVAPGGGGAAEFQRGNANGLGALDISDGIALLNFLFLGADEPPCLDAADTNDSGLVDIADAVAVFGYLFTGGAAPPPPGPNDCGSDPTRDGLGCESFSICD